jgi:hypothetical protein
MITKTALIKLFPPMSRIDTISCHYKGMPMNRTLLALSAGALIVLAGCGGGGGGGSNDTGGNGNKTGPVGTKLGLYSDRVKSCTPYLSIGSLSSATGILLADWNSWSPDVSGSVLGKLFDPANGKDECIYSQVQVLDSHINLINQFSDQWLTSGTYTQGTMTAVVDTTATTVTIPFLGSDSPDTMDRLVTLSDPAQNLTINMAFYQSGSNQTIVEQYVMGNAVSAVLLARIIGSDVQIWFASIGDHKVQGMWEGDTSSKTFKLSECTNASAGNWEVMGGGSVANSTSEMAFMARNNQNNNSSDSDTYNITTTLNGLENDTLQSIFNADAKPPNPNTDMAQAYITDGDPECFGFLGIQNYPNTLDDLAWGQ